MGAVGRGGRYRERMCKEVYSCYRDFSESYRVRVSSGDMLEYVF